MKEKLPYTQIVEVADWVNKNREEVAKDGMNIIIAIADEEKLRRMCLTGESVRIATMLDLLIEGAYNSIHEQINQRES